MEGERENDWGREMGIERARGRDGGEREEWKDGSRESGRWWVGRKGRENETGRCREGEERQRRDRKKEREGSKAKMRR